jgi:hypothetical protein
MKQIKLGHLGSWGGLLAVLLLALSAGTLTAQPADAPPGFDPEQIRQQIQSRITQYFRDQLVVTNDAEWQVIEGRLLKVLRGKAEGLLGGGGMMMGMGGGRFGGGGMGGPMGGPGNRGGGLRTLLGLDPFPEADALQKVLDEHGSKAEIKNALNKYLAARKRREAETAKTQDELRQVLTYTQEATLVLMGVLD